MTKLIALLSALLSLVEGWQRRRDEKRRQDEADNLADDPSGWFNDHFNGLYSQPDDTDQADPNSRER